MTYYVVPASLDTGALGRRIEADSPEAAVAQAIDTILGDHSDESMIVRWDVTRDRKGEVLTTRMTEVEPKGGKKPAPAPAPEPKVDEKKAEAPKAAEPAPAAKADDAKDTGTAKADDGKGGKS